LTKDKNTAPSSSVIQGFAEGNEQAFDEVFHYYFDRVYHFALKFVHNASEAEEICQEVFVKLWESRKAVDANANFGAYLFTITRNLIFNKSKKKVNEWAYLDHLKHHLKKNSQDTEQVVFLEEVTKIINSQVEAMPEKRRQVFELSRINGLSHKEISEKLNISTKTIEVHISLALKKLRLALRDYYVLFFF